MAFPESFLQELCDRNDIAEVVSSYVRLTKRSGANLFGLCPFHSEKTPSFSVSQDKQIYHCFGCGKGGGVINFIMEIENLSYPDAVRHLARRAGLAIPEEERDENHSKRERMLEINRQAARFFYDRLRSEEGQTARDYIERREISPSMVKTFGLGFAPDSWDSLCNYLMKKGCTKPELLSAGLARASKKGDGGIYDTFRNRLMFPVIDVRGSVIGFSGRILDDGEPKYMNSPETLVFNKSRNLFALNLAKKSKKGYIILSEGNIDVVALHQAGFDCAVASLGTSLTPEQARLISRYTREVVIAYDGDTAGQKAAQRGIDILEKLDVKVRVLRLEGAKDPDDYIKKFGKAAFENLLAQSENHIEYRLLELSSKHNLETDEGRVSFLKDAAELIARLSGAVEREVYAHKAGDMAKVSGEAVLSEVVRFRKRLIAEARKKRDRQVQSPVKIVQPKERSLRFENTHSAVAERGLICLLYYEPSLFNKLEVKGEDFSSPILGRLFDELKLRAGRGLGLSLSLLAESFSNEEISLLTDIVQQPQELSNAEKALSDYINIIKTEKLARQQKDSSHGDELLAVRDEMLRRKRYGG
ncbi:MAG: DNA primase [Clostridiales bacterium]|nr:DNA primase [Clostridiales bacterium]